MLQVYTRLLLVRMYLLTLVHVALYWFNHTSAKFDTVLVAFITMIRLPVGEDRQEVAALLSAALRMRNLLDNVD